MQLLDVFFSKNLLAPFAIRNIGLIKIIKSHNSICGYFHLIYSTM